MKFKQVLCLFFILVPALSADALTLEKQQLLANFWNKKQEVIYPSKIPAGYNEKEFNFSTSILSTKNPNRGGYFVEYSETLPLLETPLGKIVFFFNLSNEKLLSNDKSMPINATKPLCSSQTEEGKEQLWSYYLAFLRQKIYFCAQPVSVQVNLIKNKQKQAKTIKRFNVLSTGTAISGLSIHANHVTKDDFAEFMSGLGLLNN
jgi:hypothetical protein